MGYDCTLHLIDEKAIREEFVPRLLARSRKKTALDRVMQNAGELWVTARKALQVDDPDTAASVVCQLAVTFSACSLPHRYERGFALSLWQDQEKDVAVEFPGEFAFSPEPLFAAVVEEHPRLRGHFPSWIIENYSTGVFIPSARVAEVLAWVEGRVAPMARGDQRRFKGLLGILRAAADQGFAYWEATDLAVPMANEFPGDPKLMLARYLGNEPGTAGRQVEEAPLTGHINSLWHGMVDEWLTSGDYSPFLTNFWDLSVWPPRLAHTLAEFAPDLSRSRDGRWLLFSETNPQAETRTFRPRLYSDLGRQADGTFPVVMDGEEESVNAGGFVGDHLVVFRDPSYDTKVGDPLPPPLWLQGKDWQPVPGITPLEARCQLGLRKSIEKPVCGVVRLADGGDVVVWQDGYELRGGRFEKTFALGARTSHLDWTCVPAGADGFFYLSNRHLFEVHRHKTAVAHAGRWTNIMSVSPGPAGSVLLQEGKNKDGDVAKLYFPADGTFIHIEPELFDDRDYSFIHWNPSVDRFIVLVGKFLAVPAAVVLSLPRYRVSTGRRVKGSPLPEHPST